MIFCEATLLKAVGCWSLAACKSSAGRLWTNLEQVRQPQQDLALLQEQRCEQVDVVRQALLALVQSREAAVEGWSSVRAPRERHRSKGEEDRVADELLQLAALSSGLVRDLQTSRKDCNDCR